MADSEKKEDEPIQEIVPMDVDSEEEIIQETK